MSDLAQYEQELVGPPPADPPAAASSPRHHPSRVKSQYFSVYSARTPHPPMLVRFGAPAVSCGLRSPHVLSGAMRRRYEGQRGGVITVGLTQPTMRLYQDTT